MAVGDFLTSVGFHVSDLAAGLSGGVVKAFLSKRASLAELIPSAITGALTANYLRAPFAELVMRGTGWTLDPGVSGFVVGLTAMAICQAIAVKVDEKLKRYRAGAADV